VAAHPVPGHGEAGGREQVDRVAGLGLPARVPFDAVARDRAAGGTGCVDPEEGVDQVVGFDPAAVWGDIGDPDNGLLRLTPWRIELNDFSGPPRTVIWRAPDLDRNDG